MNREQARGIAHVVSSDAIQRLDALLHFAERVTPPRCFVQELRDKLHEACTRFENGTDTEEFEEWYLPLFDALSEVTHAARFSPPLPGRLKSALRRLCALHSRARSVEGGVS